ncbi:MAG: NgoBV family restriction endonuclease [Clostridiales Family XIII bacterium]|jgi:type II restriction enzyme|nr:NgoBV family restriction endonuclease [Clostridiales Family XIII bacterium]
MYGIKAQQLYDGLNRHHIVGSAGKISVELLNVKCDLNDKSAVGNLLQEWLGAWMVNKNIYHRTNPNTQEFPDFFLSTSNTSNLLEVKTFDFSKAPNFDIANFDAYVRSVMTKSYRLDADYLILGYILTNSRLKIENIWLKKIWEITCSSKKYALKSQVKQEKIVNIRPYNFKTMSQGFQPFATRLDFINAVKQTLEQYQMRTVSANDWLSAVQTNYNSAHRGNSL